MSYICFLLLTDEDPRPGVVISHVEDIMRMSELGLARHNTNPPSNSTLNMPRRAEINMPENTGTDITAEHNQYPLPGQPDYT